jgi:hypothetical protein
MVPGKDGPDARARPASGRRESVADETRRYVESRPSIRDCVRYDIVNFTALARRIRAETGLGSQEAIEIACRRYGRQLRDEEAEEERLRDLLRKSHLQIRTHVAVLTVQGDLEFLERLVVGAQRLQAKRSGLVQLFQGSGLVTVLCEDQVLGSIMNVVPKGSVVFVRRRLSALSVHTPEEVLSTPRILGFLADAIGRAGINCIEMMSVHTETLFILRPMDAVRAFELLTELSHSLEGAGEVEPKGAEETEPAPVVPATRAAPARGMRAGPSETDGHGLPHRRSAVPAPAMGTGPGPG